MTHSPKRLRSESSVLVVVDVQDKLLVKIPRRAELVKNIGFLLDVAKLVEVPVRATEQYPKGLGATTKELARRLPATLPAKTTFSCCGAENFLEELEVLRRPDIVVVGMETHVCVAQTVFDLLAAGLHVYLPVDALASRGDIDHATAIRRLELAGAVPTTVEAAAFEWVGNSAHPKFKDLSRLVIDRG